MYVLPYTRWRDACRTYERAAREAEIPYEQVLEMDEINSDFSNTDVVLVLGANDVVNPAANVPGSPIYGMPILDAHKARTIMVVKRSMAAG